MTLDQLLAEYLVIQQQEEKLKSKKDSLKAKILKSFSDKEITKYVTSDGNIESSVVEKETIKYDDEVAIIKYLKENSLNKYIKESINKSSFNKDLKSSKLLQESLEGKFSCSLSPALTVKSVKSII